jgi:hypothetical protein
MAISLSSGVFLQPECQANIENTGDDGIRANHPDKGDCTRTWVEHNAQAEKHRDGVVCIAFISSLSARGIPEKHY